jgi:transposase
MPLKLTQDEREARRRRAVELVLTGTAQADAAREVGVGPGTVRRWMILYGMYGDRGLRPRPHGGSSRLTEDQRRQLRKVLALGAKKSGYGDDEWDGFRVAAVILQLFGVHYSSSHAARFLADVPRLVGDR